MELVYPVTSFIVTNFKNFYYEVLRQKAYALRATHQANEESEEIQSGEVICRNIQQHLYEILEAQALDASKQVGEFAAAHHQEAQYVMVALADEVFLNFDWDGRRYWEDHVLETRVFHTQMAGERFFQRLDELIRAHDPVKIDLAIVYLFALGLGFRGKFHADGSEILLRYREQLFTMIVHRPSDLFYGGREHLVDAPYEHNLYNEHRKALPEVRLWLWSFAGIALIYLFVSYALWYGAIHDVERAVSSLLTQAQTSS